MMSDFFDGYEAGWRACLDVMSEEWPHLSEGNPEDPSIIELAGSRMQSIMKEIKSLSSVSKEEG